MRRFFLPVAALAAGSFVLTQASPARASGDGELLAVAVALAIYDAAAIPADLYMAAKGQRPSADYALSEAALGGLQALGGAIGLGACEMSKGCRTSVAIPLLAVFTAWTTAMTLHGAFTYTPKAANNTKPSTDPNAGTAPTKAPQHVAAPVQARMSLTPIFSTGRGTTAGMGFVAVF